MPYRETLERAEKDAQEGKSPSTQAGEFVREEIHHIREGKHGARSPQQAIAIGLSEARRAGVKLSPPKGPAAVRKKAAQDAAAGQKAKDQNAHYGDRDYEQQRDSDDPVPTGDRLVPPVRVWLAV